MNRARRDYPMAQRDPWVPPDLALLLDPRCQAVLFRHEVLDHPVVRRGLEVPLHRGCQAGRTDHRFPVVLQVRPLLAFQRYRADRVTL